ncbi:MAG: CPBP family intramembrane glutamic endopeptidase [Pseudomonadota bacterium]
MVQSELDYSDGRQNVLARNEALIAALIWALFMLPVMSVLVTALSYVHFYAHAPSAEALWDPWYDNTHPLSQFYWGYVILAAYFGLRFWLNGVGGLAASHKLGLDSPAILLLAFPAIALDWAFVSGFTELVSAFTGGSEIAVYKPGYETDVTRANLFGWLLVGVIAAPLFEELAFRGFFFGCLIARGWSPQIVVGVTSAAFAVTHIQYEPVGMFMVFVSGIILGTLRLIGRGLLLPIITHGLLNFTIFATAVA